MKTKILGGRGAFLLAALALPLAADAADPGYAVPVANGRPAVAANNYQAYRPVAAAVPAPRVMAGRWGFGLDTVPGASSNPVSGALIAAPNAVAVRWWATEKLGLDLMAALDASSLQTSGGGLSAASAPGTAGSGWGVGLGVKYGFSRPSRDLHVQGVLRASTAASSQKDATGLITLNSSTTGLFLGLGFEAFVPGWDWLSLEGSAGLSVVSEQLKPESSAGAGSGASQTNSTVSLGGAGFTPINLAIHAYF